MLKRQRPATPPPSSLGDPPSFLPNESIRPLHPRDPSEHCSKRRRTQPPPLDGALRGWLESEPAGSHWESDGEEDWIEDPHTELGSSLPPSTTASPYKDANILLHELHVLNQHRLLFTRPPREQLLNPTPRMPLPPPRTHMETAPVGYGPTAWTNGLQYHPTFPQFTGDGIAGRSCRLEVVEDKGVVEEVQCVRQRYEGTNKLLGSLFLSRRREVEGMTSSAPSC